MPKLLNDHEQPSRENKDTFDKRKKCFEPGVDMQFSESDPQLKKETLGVKHSLISIQLNSTEMSHPQKKRRNNYQKPIHQYLCGVCQNDCVDNPQNELDQSVNCDGCAVWVHYVCAGVDDKDIQLTDNQFCQKCQNNFKFSVQDKI